MSDVVEGRPWGLCAAYGCPLLGSLGSEGRWYCFCHVGNPSSSNDAISQELRSHELSPIVQSTLDIRRNFSSFYGKEDAYRMIQERLIRMGRKDLLMSDEEKKKGGARAWFMRLERVLIDATRDLGRPAQMPATVPTAPVIGPTHAMQHYSEPQS